MNPDRQRNDTAEFEAALAAQSARPHYLLRLYVSGSTQRSVRAIQNIRELCEEKLHGRYTLEVIDIYQQPDALKPDQILVTPTLIKRLPLPFRRIIGDLSDTERVLIGLDLVPLAAPVTSQEPPRGTG